jgi:hypothetical protein
MPRKPIQLDERYVELALYVVSVERDAADKIASLKNEIAQIERKMLWHKSEAIMHALKSGLSVYGVAKAAGIKSSTKRKNLIEYCQENIANYYGGNA